MDEVLYLTEMCDIEAQKAEILLESYEEYSVLEEKAAALRAYVNGDIAVFDEDASTTAADKKKNLITAAWDKIKALLKSIADTITSVISKITGNDNAVVQVPEAYADAKNRQKLKSVVAEIKKIGTSTPAKAIAAIASLITVVVVAYKGASNAKAASNVKKTLNMSGRDAKELAKEYNVTVSDLSKVIDKLAKDEANAVLYSDPLHVAMQAKVDKGDAEARKKLRSAMLPLVQLLKQVAQSLVKRVASAGGAAKRKVQEAIDDRRTTRELNAVKDVL